MTRAGLLAERRRASTTPRRWASAAALCAYLLFSCLRFWPTVPWSATDLLHSGNHDPAQMVWFLTWSPWALFHGANPFFSHAIAYPHGVNLATNTSVPLLGLLGSPVTFLVGPVATFNLLMRLSLALSAFALFLVLRRWVPRFWPAFLGGAVFGFSSSELRASALHLDLAFVVFLPLMLLALDELFARQVVPPWVSGTALGVLAVAQWFVDPEYLVDSAVLALCGLAVLALQHRHQVAAHLRRALPGILPAVGLPLVALAYPVWYLTKGPRHLHGPVLATWLVSGYRMDLLGPFSSTLREEARAPADQAANFHPSVLTYIHSEAYMGVALVVVLVALALWGWRRDAVLRFFVVMTAIAFVWCLGTELSVNGHLTGIPLPAALFAHLPLLDNLWPIRVAVFLWLFAAVVLAVGLDRLLAALADPVGGKGRTEAPGPGEAGPAAPRGRRHRAPAGWRLGASVGAVVVAGASFLPVVTAAPPLVATPVPGWPQAKVVASTTPPGGVVLVLPYIAIKTDEPMVWQAESHFPYHLVGGYALQPLNKLSALFYPVPSPALRPLVDSTEVPVTVGHQMRGPAAVAAACRAVPAVVSAYHLDTLVVWRAPTANVALTLRAVRAALGPPSVREGPLFLWTRLGGAVAHRAHCPPGGSP
jgi:hypothetical protein